MARRNSPGCYCCNDCDKILEEELPCVIPPDEYTRIENWYGGSCCKCILFRKSYSLIESDWQCDDVSVVNSSLEVNQNWLASELPPPPVVCGGNCETLRTQGAYYCCTSEPFIAATSVTTGEGSWRTRIEYRRLEDVLQVCIKKGTVICNGESQVKWIVHARLFQTLGYLFLFYNRTINIQRTFSNVADCFSINDNEFLPYNCDCELNYSTELNADCHETLPILGAGLLGGDDLKFASSYFDYVLFFDEDEWPPESFLLDSSAVPNGCTYSTCNLFGDFNFDDTACVGFSNFALGTRPCWCDAELNCQAVTLEVPLNFACTPPATLFSCDCDQATPPTTVVCSIEEPWDPFECGTYEANSIACVVDGIGDPNLGCENSLLGAFTGGVGWHFIICNSWTYFVGPSTFRPNYCTNAGPCSGYAPCNACCQEYGDCQCAPKYGQSIVETTSLTQDFECTWIPWSYCWTRPTIMIMLEVQPCIQN